MILTNGRVFIDGSFHDYDIEILDGRIKRIKRNLQENHKIDVKRNLIFPGFIDTHIHGTSQVNCGDSVEAMYKICETLPSFGVTSFTPTPIADTIPHAVQAVRNIRKAKGCAGSDILGIFLYTPYKNRSIAYYGEPVYPTIEHTLQMVDGDLSDIFSILIAPELNPDHKWLEWIVSNGILPVIGFTEGNEKDIHEAVKYGAVLTDHFYNGFPPLDHHKNVSTAYCLLEEHLYFQMNCDCVHVAVPFLRLAIAMKGVKGILPVSDSSMYVGMPQGKYHYAGIDVYVKDGAVRDENGKLVTGAHSYDENMRTMLRNGFSLEEIGIMFTENAANILNLKDRGKIEKDRRADLVIMDHNLNVLQTYIMGELVYQR